MSAGDDFGAWVEGRHDWLWQRAYGPGSRLQRSAARWCAVKLMRAEWLFWRCFVAPW